MEAMKINIPVQRKTSIESYRNPEAKQLKTQFSMSRAVRPLTGAV